MVGKTEPSEEKATHAKQNAYEFSVDWSENTKKKSLQAVMQLSIGMPAEVIAKELDIPEIDLKRMRLVQLLEEHRTPHDLMQELGIINGQQIMALRKECSVMNGMQVLSGANENSVSEEDHVHLLRFVNTDPIQSIGGVKDAGVLQFQQKFGPLVFAEKKRILEGLKTKPECALLTKEIEKKLQVIEGQAKQIEHAQKAMAIAIDRAKPAKPEEFFEALAADGCAISDDIRQVLNELIAEFEGANVSPAKGFKTKVDLTNATTIDEVLKMAPEKQIEVLVAAITLLHAKSAGLTRSKFSDGMRTVVMRLGKRPLPMNKCQASVFIMRATNLHRTCCALPSAGVLGAIERYAGENDLDPSIAGIIQNYAAELAKGPHYSSTGRSAPDASDKTAMHKLKLLLETPSNSDIIPIPIEPHEAWSDQAIADLRSFDASLRTSWIHLIKHCLEAKGSKPSEKWMKASEQLIAKIGDENFVSQIERWFALIQKKGTRVKNYDPMWNPDPAEEFCSDNVDILRGLAWACSRKKEPRIVVALGDAAEACFKKVKNLGPRCPRFGNACVHALSEINTKEAVTQLGRVQAKTKHASVQKQVGKALTHAADQSGMTVDELQDMSVPDFGMTESGVLKRVIGEWEAELQLGIADSITINWKSTSNKTQKSVPAELKTRYAEELKTLKRTESDIQKVLPGIRARIERSFIDQRHWRFDVFSERYLNHPLTSTFARRLLWSFNGRAAIWYEGKLITEDGTALAPEPADLVELWHPISSSPETVLHWRRWLSDREITQPFKQCHREIYVLTDAERNTETYSNRFASHILLQHRLQHLCMDRGWHYKLMGAFDSHSTPTLQLPRWDLAVEYWVEPLESEGVGNTGIFSMVASDQVRFLRKVDPASLLPAGNIVHLQLPTVAYAPVPLTEIMPIVFSEVMRDVDLFVSVCSVGTDPTLNTGAHADYWSHFSFGELNNTAQTRKEILEPLIKSLKIAPRCKIDDKFLIVTGDLNTYKIHLGSGNILMEPNDEYLCIVSERGLAAGGNRVFLPFEGDQMLSIILSKAVLLAEDSKITDQSIVRQIKRQR